MIQTEPTFRAHRARVGNAWVYYQVGGEGPALVLVHGLSGSSRWWRRNMRALGQQFRVHVIDLVSFGQSRAPERFVLRRAAASLLGWMDTVAIDRCHLIGHSMGGFIAADLAAAHPERVDRLVLVDAAALPFGRNYFGHAYGLARAVRRLPLNFYPTLITDAYRAGPITIAKAAWELLGTDISDRLNAIENPVLVVWGEHDTAVPLDIGRKLAERLTHAQLTIIRGAGHNPMWDRPEAFNRAVLAFLTNPVHPSS